MPEDSYEHHSKDVITLEEIKLLVEVFHSFGINKIRLTGGEPTLRPDLTEIVRFISNYCPNIELNMTTNGVLLEKFGIDLLNAGLKRINISIDAIDPVEFQYITQRNQYQKMMNGILFALQLGFESIKLNVVAIKDFTERQIPKFIKFIEGTNLEVRFIELMPFSGNLNFQDKFLSKNEILQVIEQTHALTPIQKDNLSQTFTMYYVDGKVKIGFIPSVTDSFCKNCDRVRITADGNLRPCLHSSNEINLTNLLNPLDPELEGHIREALRKKWKEHPDFRIANYRPPLSDRAMILIGG